MLRKLLHIFAIRKGERRLALGALLFFMLLNALLIYRYYDRFTLGGNLGFWTIFYKTFHVSGFDAYSYITMSNLRIHYVTSRHPLYLSMLLPFYWLNSWQMQYTNYNLAVYFEAFIVIFCAVYSFLFLYRTLHEVVSVSHKDAVLLTAFFFSFAHVLLTAMVPDHFIISLFLLMLTVYVAGRRIKSGRQLRPVQTALLLFFTAGITVTNGVKTILAALFVNGRRAFRWPMLLAYVVPVLLLWGIWQWQYTAYEVPQAEQVKKLEDNAKRKDPHFAEHHKAHDDFVKRQNGVPVAEDVPLLEWSDVGTNRWHSAVDNLFGETFILHRDHLLEDVLQERPVFVSYTNPFLYVLEAMIAVLFAVGVWMGRRERLMQMLLSWFAFDMVMHFGFGFGLNEVYIMAAHWTFIIPIAVGYCLKNPDEMGEKCKSIVRWAVAMLMVWLLTYNGYLTMTYLFDR